MTAEASAITRKPESEATSPEEASTAATPSARTTCGRVRFASAKPRQSAPANACGMRTVTSRDHQPLQLGHVRRPDARHALELGDRVERAVRLAVVEDLLRRHRTDPRQALELLERRRVEVERGRWRGAGRGRAHSDAARRTASRDDDLLAVGDWRGEVDRVELRLGGRPPGGCDRVVNPRSRAESIETRVTDGSRDVD